VVGEDPFEIGRILEKLSSLGSPEIAAGIEMALWDEFRYGRIRTELADSARGHDKELSAAVFATPELSRRYVRQDWPSWPLDGLPGQPLTWIREATWEGSSLSTSGSTFATSPLTRWGRPSGLPWMEGQKACQSSGSGGETRKVLSR